MKLGKPATLTFKITDPVTNEPVKGLKDVQVLVVEPPGVWQTRLWAKEAGDGLYEVTQDFPEVGLYRVMLQVESRGVRFNHLPFVSVPVNKE